MGKESNKLENLKTDLYSELVIKMPEYYLQLVDKYNSLMHKEMSLENYIKEDIRTKIRDDKKYLIKIIGINSFDAHSENDKYKLLKVLFYMRKESGDFFYHKSKNEIDKKANKSINAYICKGKLDYDYENYCKLILKMYCKEFQECDYNNKQLFIAQELIYEAELLKKYLLRATMLNNEVIYNQDWDMLFNLLVKMCNMAEYVNDKSKQYLVSLLYLDVVTGIIRDILIGVDSSRRTDIIKYYICSVRKQMAEIQEDINEIPLKQYSCVQDYLLKISLLSISKERVLWKEIAEYLITEESYKNRINKRIDKSQQDIITKKIMSWFCDKYSNSDTISEEVLYNAVFDECFIYNNYPKWLSRRGIEHFYDFLESEEHESYKNMSSLEMFYYEKIIRGLFRVNNNISFFNSSKNELIELYDLEIALIEHFQSDECYLEKIIISIKKGLIKLNQVIKY